MTPNPSFFFAGDQGVKTPEDLARKRAIVDAMMQQQAEAATPRNFGEGLSAIGKALLVRQSRKGLEGDVSRIASDQTDLWNSPEGKAALGMGGQPQPTPPLTPVQPQSAQAAPSMGFNHNGGPMPPANVITDSAPNPIGAVPVGPINAQTGQAAPINPNMPPALSGGQPVAVPAAPVQPPVPQGAASGQLQALMMVANDPRFPFAPPAKQKMVIDQIQAIQAQSTPLAQLQLRAAELGVKKSQAELDAMGGAKFEKIGDTIVKIMPDGSIQPAYSAPPNLPAGVQEYEYAVRQGFKGTFQDWESSKKGGMSLTVDPTTGEVSFTQGGNMKPLTEAQGKDAVFYTRGRGSLDTLDKVGNALTSPYGAVASSLPGGNYIKGSEYQKAEQAGNEFLTAILRKDSGAVIGKEELASYGNTYLPRPGDGPEVLAQKKAARGRALEALRSGMTPQAILQSETALKKSGNPDNAVPVPSGSGNVIRYDAQGNRMQ